MISVQTVASGGSRRLFQQRCYQIGECGEGSESFFLVLCPDMPSSFRAASTTTRRPPGRSSRAAERGKPPSLVPPDARTHRERPCAAPCNEVTWNQGWDVAQPHSCKRAPSQMNVPLRKYTFVEGPSNRTGKYVRFIQDHLSGSALTTSNRVLKSLVG
jgi:hypothetical protein